MSGSIIRILVIIALGLLIYFGVRRIWSDWTGKFRDLDKQDRQRDLAERKRPDVIELKRDKDGKFRPGDGDDDRPDRR
jgi:hypothetical protein